MKTESYVSERAAPGSFTLVMREANQGNQTAESVLWERVRPTLKIWVQARLAADRVGQIVEPDDLIQEVWLKVKKTGGYEFPNRKAFYKFLSLSLHRIIIDIARKEFGPHREAVRQALLDTMKSQEAYFHGLLVEDTLAFGEAFQQLHKAKPDYAELLLYKYGLGFTNTELAEAMGTSVATIKRELAEQLKWARGFLKMFYDDARATRKRRP